MISPLANGIISLLVMACLVAYLILSRDPEKRVLLWVVAVVWGLIGFLAF
jgi:hypothetical protein